MWSPALGLLFLAGLLPLSAPHSPPPCSCTSRYTYLPAACYDTSKPPKHCSFAGQRAIEVTILATHRSLRGCLGARRGAVACLTPTTHYGYSDGGGHQDANRQRELRKVKQILKSVGRDATRQHPRAASPGPAARQASARASP